MQVKQFIKDVKGEMKYVKWPTRRMVILSSFATIMVSTIVGLYLGELDIVLKKIFAQLVSMF